MKRIMTALMIAALLALPGVVFAAADSVSTDVYGRLNGNGPAPAVSSCGASAVVGTGSTDTAGFVTQANGQTTCTLTFGKAYAVAPFCMMYDSTTAQATTAGLARVTAVSTTAVTFTFAAAPTNADVLRYACIGLTP